jgi:hypothetical protein
MIGARGESQKGLEDSFEVQSSEELTAIAVGFEFEE